MVFQNYALYPHMTVKENISFALKHCKMEMPVYEENERYDELTEKLKGLLKQIDAIDKKINKKNVEESVFGERDEIYQQVVALLKEREEFTKQIYGKDELRIRKIESTIAQLQKRVDVMKRDADKCKDETTRNVIEDGIKEREERIRVLNEDLEFLNTIDVPLHEKRKMKWHEILIEVYNAVEILDLKKYLYRKPAAHSLMNFTDFASCLNS